MLHELYLYVSYYTRKKKKTKKKNKNEEEEKNQHNTTQTMQTRKRMSKPEYMGEHNIFSEKIQDAKSISFPWNLFFFFVVDVAAATAAFAATSHYKISQITEEEKNHL